MKLENKRAAQEQRSKERETQKKRDLFKKIGLASIPFLIVIAFIVASHFIPDQTEELSAVVTPNADGTVNIVNGNLDAENDEYSTDRRLKAREGDRVNIDYEGFIDGESIGATDPANGGTDVVIGQGLYFDGLEESLIGHRPGDIVKVKLTFPDDYYNENLAGKTGDFNITLNGIYE